MFFGVRKPKRLFEKSGLRRFLLPVKLLLLVAIAGGGVLGSIHLYRSYSFKQREKLYDSLIKEAAKRHRISPFLVKAVIRQESKFHADARGLAGEVGLMQIREGAAKDWCQYMEQDYRYIGNLFNPALNIEIGTWYLSRARKSWSEYFQVCDQLALAQYNAGRENAKQWKPDDKREKELKNVSFPSTEEYIKNVIKYKDQYKRKSLGSDEN